MAEEAKTPVIDLEALTVDVRLLGTPQGKMVGLATVKYHGFEMDNFKVFNGENGLFLGEPTVWNDRSRSYVKTVHARGQELRDALNKKALEGYNAAVEKLVARATAAKSIEVKPSVREQIADVAKQAAKENAVRPAPVRTDKSKGTR